MTPSARDLVDEILAAPQVRESELRTQRDRVAELKRRLAGIDGPAAADLSSVVDHLVRRSVWIVGGDGWAYDIGSGGLDHVLASGRNVNVLVLDTEVYSNTGGQSSKSTPLGAVAKFANAGKSVAKKDVALQAMAYGNVYVARVAMGADPQQTLHAFREAEAYDGPSLIIAYSHCIAHGIEMSSGLDQQYRAVASGHWPLVRYDPVVRAAGENPFLLDSPRPRISLADYRYRELRFRTPAPTPIPRKPSGCWGWPSRRSCGAGTSTRTWRAAPPRTSPRTPGRRRDGPADDVSRIGHCATRSSRRRRRFRRASKAYGGWRAAGVGAVVLYSLFEEQVRREAERDAWLADAGTESFGESLSYFPATAEGDPGPRRYLSLLERSVRAVDVPVIASLNGITPGSWAGYAQAMEDAGASAIELNIYYLPGDPKISGREVERRHVDVLRVVKDAVAVPIAVKLSPLLQLHGGDGVAARRRRG